MNMKNKPPKNWKKLPQAMKDFIIKCEIDNRLASVVLSQGNPDPNDAEAIMANLLGAVANPKKSAALAKKIEAEVRKEFK